MHYPALQVSPLVQSYLDVCKASGYAHSQQVSHTVSLLSAAPLSACSHSCGGCNPSLNCYRHLPTPARWAVQEACAAPTLSTQHAPHAAPRTITCASCLSTPLSNSLAHQVADQLGISEATGSLSLEGAALPDGAATSLAAVLPGCKHLKGACRLCSLPASAARQGPKGLVQLIWPCEDLDRAVSCLSHLLPCLIMQ